MNHFVFTYFYALNSKYYTYYLTFKNIQFDRGGNGIKISYSNWRAPDNLILSEIIFCNYDEYLQIGDSRIRKECKKAEWLDGFYRRLQIFDIRYSAKNPIFFSHQFEDDGINGMIKQRN